ncbi:hypothetical protein HZ326_20679 [Fusarium oxysporum f. sp. albedinis]|nr:hypothetical protein HZ326_20679 [Fusarium oxysporum f. sp. albedinis]
MLREDNESMYSTVIQKSQLKLYVVLPTEMKGRYLDSPDPMVSFAWILDAYRLNILPCVTVRTFCLVLSHLRTFIS